MGFLLRRSWNNRGGYPPGQWEKPVNQASKWLIARSGSQRLQAAGGSFTISNSETRKFVWSVFVGDGGSCNLGGTSGANTVQISRTGSTITITAQPNSGSATTKTATTDMPADRWTNVYVECVVSGALSNQVTLTAKIDFVTAVSMFATGDIFGNSFPTNGKTVTFDALSGWSWFADAKVGFFGWGASSTIPISDDKYREAVLNNATWDLDTDTSLHTWYWPQDARYVRAWLIQGGGGKGGKGGKGADGMNGSSGSGDPKRGCTRGTAGGSGGRGGRGGNEGSNGYPGGLGSQPTGYSAGSGDNDCKRGVGGDGGSGGSGGAGGAGVMVQVTIPMQSSMQLQAGAAGTPGSGGGPFGGDGGDGGDGLHTTLAGMSTEVALPYSNGRRPDSIAFGKTTFDMGPMGAGSCDGGAVFYVQW